MAGTKQGAAINFTKAAKVCYLSKAYVTKECYLDIVYYNTKGLRSKRSVDNQNLAFNYPDSVVQGTYSLV